MFTIWKFPFEVADSIEIEMPGGAQVLSVQTQNETPCLWALVNPKAMVERRKFRIFGTGQPIEPKAMTYVGTFQMPPFVWHLFEEA